jgi:hypothetical protein
MLAFPYTFILLIYLLFTKANIQSWLGNTIRYSIGGIVSMAGLGTGLNYLYNSYNNNLPQNKKPEKVSYDLNGNSRINFWEYSASLLAAKEEKFSTIALVNLLSFGIAIYMQLTGQIVPQIITDTIQTSILGLSAMNVLGTVFGCQATMDIVLMVTVVWDTADMIIMDIHKDTDIKHKR